MVLVRRSLSNPFDRKENPLVTIAFHTPSLETHLRDPNSAASRLLRLAEIPEITLLCLPDLNNRPVTLPGVVSGIYEQWGDGAALVTGDDAMYGLSSITNVDPLSPVRPGSSLRYGDLGVARTDIFVDWMVVDPQLLTHFEPPNIPSRRILVITPEDCLELIRLLLTGNHRFYLTPSRKCDDSYYYNYRLSRLFPLTALPPLAPVNSLRNRCSFLLRATDHVLFLTHKSLQPYDYMGYHLAYSTVLLPGITEDIMRIAMFTHKIKLNKKQQKCNLRVGDASRAFYSRLRDRNPALYAYLRSEQLQKDLEAVYEIRHVIAHRDFITPIDRLRHGIHFVVEDLKPELFQTNPTLQSWFEVSGDPEKPLFSPERYARWAVDFATAFVRKVVGLLGYDSRSQAVNAKDDPSRTPLYF